MGVDGRGIGVRWSEIGAGQRAVYGTRTGHGAVLGN